MQLFIKYSTGGSWYFFLKGDNLWGIWLTSKLLKSTKMPRKLMKFLILFDNTNLLFFPGQFLSGRVLLELQEDTPALGEKIFASKMNQQSNKKRSQQKWIMQSIKLSVKGRKKILNVVRHHSIMWLRTNKNDRFAFFSHPRSSFPCRGRRRCHSENSSSRANIW